MNSAVGKSSINTFSGGMNMDVDKSILKNNQYRYAENIRTVANDSSSTGAITNIEGSSIIEGITLATGEQIIGTATVRNIGIVFTATESQSVFSNKIYRITFDSDGEIVSTTNVLNSDGINFNIPENSNLSIVTRYEDDDNIKVYWADGVNYIRSINISESVDSINSAVTTPEIFDIIPSADMSQPEISGIGAGRLNSGVIQYCYQFYSASGTESMLSPMSPQIHLTDSSIYDKDIKYTGTGIGQLYGKPTGKSVKLKIDIPADNTFTDLKLISVYYFNYSDDPIITVVKNVDISSNIINGSVYVEDGGVSAIGEMSVSELNLIGANIFIPNYIESKDNILFAANTKESTFDIDTYDTRSYQFNKNAEYNYTEEITFNSETTPNNYYITKSVSQPSITNLVSVDSTVTATLSVVSFDNIAEEITINVLLDYDPPGPSVYMPYILNYDDNGESKSVYSAFDIEAIEFERSYTIVVPYASLEISNYTSTVEIYAAQITCRSTVSNYTANGSEIFAYEFFFNGVSVREEVLQMNSGALEVVKHLPYFEYDNYNVIDNLYDTYIYDITLDYIVPGSISGDLHLTYINSNQSIGFTMTNGYAQVSVQADEEISSSATFNQAITTTNVWLSTDNRSDYNLIIEYYWREPEEQVGDNKLLTFTMGIGENYTEPQTIYSSENIISTFGSAKYLDTKTKLHSASGSFIEISKDALTTIPFEHDTIHYEIYNTSRYADIEYRYDADGNLGGSGINVDYSYANTYFIESYSNFYGETPGIGIPATEKDLLIDSRTARIGDVKRSSLSKIMIANSDGIGNGYHNLSEFRLPTHDGSINYSNPYLSNNFKSYQRDEIYRFAAVFYDEKGRKSPAKWIADIRLPAGYVEDTNWNSSIFEMPEEVSSPVYADTFYEDQELLVKPLGIKFTFKNLDTIPGVTKIEIVRAKRDINNKTIYAQGVVQKVGTYKGEWTESYDKLLTDSGIINSLMPHPIISSGYSYSLAIPTLKSVSGYPNEFPDSRSVSFDNWAGGTTDWITERTELSPLRYNKDFILFINPETSHYGADFTQQLINIKSNPSIDIVDCIFPVSTTPTLNSSDEYFGQITHDRLHIDYAGSVYNTALYMAADINPLSKILDYTPISGGPSIAGGNFYSMGLTGAKIDYIVGINGSPVYATGYGDPETSDMYELGVLSKIGTPAYISLGGVMNVTDDFPQYKSGFNGQITTDTGTDADFPPMFDSVVYSNKMNAITFKYFNRFSTKGVDGSGMSILLQNSNVLSDADTKSISDLNELSTGNGNYLWIDTSSISYSGRLSNSETINSVSTSNYVSIGGKLYINYSKSISDRQIINDREDLRNIVEKSKADGQHGDGIIMHIDQSRFPSILSIDYSKNRYINNSGLSNRFKSLDNIASCGLATYVTNMKVMNNMIYGGSSISDRQFTEYISTGAIIDISSSSETKIVFGGDTFIGLFDYTITRYTDPLVNKYTAGEYVYPSDVNNEDGIASIRLNRRKYIGALLPLESSINLHLVNSKSYIASGYEPYIDPEAGVHGPGLNEGATYTYTQELPQHSYNAAYSTENTAIVYLSKLIKTEDNNVFDCRVWSSSVKTNDETYDSWATFKVANYIDVDTEYGQITGLKKFNNKLLFWQKNAFGVLSVNERSLIQDNNISGLTLGTGGILSRYDYISTSNGRKFGCINNLAASESNLYWYDHDRAEMCIFNGQLVPLSKVKGLQTVFNANKSNIENNIPMVFDKKYGEISITLNGLIGADSID